MHMVTVSTLLNKGQVTQAPTTAANTNLLWQELFTMQKEMINMRKENGNFKALLDQIQREYGDMKVRLDQIQVENNELKKNQSALILEVQGLKNKSESDIANIPPLTLSSITTRIEDLERNQSAIVNLPVALNTSIESLKSLQRATAGMSSSLQGEQIADRLLISGLQKNLSDVYNYVSTLQHGLHNTNDILDHRFNTLEGVIHNLNNSIKPVFDGLERNIESVNSSVTPRLDNLRSSITSKVEIVHRTLQSDLKNSRGQYWNKINNTQRHFKDQFTE